MIFDLFSNALVGTFCFANSLTESLKFRYIILMFSSNWLFTYFLYGTPYLVGAVVSFNLIIILLFSKNKAINGIAALIGYISSVMCNNLMIIFIQKTINLDAQSILANRKYLLIFNICFLVVVYLVSTLISKLFKYFVAKSAFAKSPSTLVLIFVELLLCATIMVFNITYARQLGYPQNTILFNCILFFVYFVLSSLLLINIVSSTRKNMAMEQELERAKQLQEYTETIEFHARQMCEFKHDYLNVLLTMDELVHESNNQQLITYFDEQIKPIGSQVQAINTSLISLAHISDTAVKSLLYNKLSYALSKGIELHLLLNFDISALPMNSLDMSKLLGIYLDNAIEGALTTDSPCLSVIFTKDDATTIEISNNFDGSAPDLSRLSENGYSSKGENRGLGLTQADQLLDKYPNVIHTINVTDNVFIQSISFS